MPVKLSALIRLKHGTRILLVLFGVLIIGVVFIGLDNPTGIIIGWLAATALLTALAHRWRKIRYFIILFSISIVGTIILSFLYVEVALPLAGWLGGANATQSTPWRIFHVIVSNLILLFTPAGIFVSIVGGSWLGISRLIALRNRRRAGST